MKKDKGLVHLFLLLIAVLLCPNCKKNAQSKSEIEKNPHNAVIEFQFSKSQFEEGEAVCLKISVKNDTGDTMLIAEYPMKDLRLFSADGQPVLKFQRAEHPKPPKILLLPGETSSDEVNLAGFFENLGPGMLSAGRYKIKTSVKYFVGKQVRSKLEGIAVEDSAEFEVIPAKEENKKAFDDYVKVIDKYGGLQDFVGNNNLKLDDTAKKELDAIAEKYIDTPLGMRILIDDLGIWYKGSLPIERYAKFMNEIDPKCPCCLHRWVIDRLIKRYVILRDREKILDIAEKGLKDYKEGTPVGDYLRRAFAFRMEHGNLIR